MENTHTPSFNFNTLGGFWAFPHEERGILSECSFAASLRGPLRVNQNYSSFIFL